MRSVATAAAPVGYKDRDLSSPPGAGPPACAAMVDRRVKDGQDQRTPGLSGRRGVPRTRPPLPGPVRTRRGTPETFATHGWHTPATPVSGPREVPPGSDSPTTGGSSKLGLNPWSSWVVPRRARLPASAAFQLPLQGPSRAVSVPEPHPSCNPHPRPRLPSPPPAPLPLSAASCGRSFGQGRALRRLCCGTLLFPWTSTLPLPPRRSHPPGPGVTGVSQECCPPPCHSRSLSTPTRRDTGTSPPSRDSTPCTHGGLRPLPPLPRRDLGGPPWPDEDGTILGSPWVKPETGGLGGLLFASFGS